MSAQDDLIAATTDAETAAVALAAAFVAYTNAYKVAASEAYAASDVTTASRDVAVLEGAIGPHVVAGLLRARLVALNAQPVVAQPGAVTPAGPEWVAYLTDQIEAHVPEVVAASRAG